MSKVGPEEEIMFDVPRLRDAEMFTARLPMNRDCSEDAGFIITADTGEHNIYLYACAYVIRSGGKGIWLHPNGRINGTIFFAIPKRKCGAGLADNNFVRAGWHFDQYLNPDQHKIEQSKDAVRWIMAGRTYEWREDVWVLKGTHGGVETDLRFRPVAPAEWRWGPFEKLIEADSGGYKAAALVDGTIRVDGQTYHLKDGYASCERAVVGQSRDIVKEVMNGNEVLAFEIRGPNCEVQIHRHTGRNMLAASLGVMGETFYFGDMAPGTKVSIKTTAHWNDPRCGLVVPSRWEVEMQCERMTVSMNVKSSGRSYFHYNTNGGVMLMMQILGLADITLSPKGGETRVMRDAVVGLRWGRGLLFANETLEGAMIP
jgi:hypothetical protein